MSLERFEQVTTTKQSLSRCYSHYITECIMDMVNIASRVLFVSLLCSTFNLAAIYYCVCVSSTSRYVVLRLGSPTTMKDAKGPISRAAEALPLRRGLSELHQAQVKHFQDNYLNAIQTPAFDSASLSDELRESLQFPQAERKAKVTGELLEIIAESLREFDSLHNNYIATLTAEEKEQYERAWSNAAMNFSWSSVTPTTSITEMFFRPGRS